MANKYRTEKRLVSELLDGPTLEVDDLVRKIAKPRQRSHSIAEAAGIILIATASSNRQHQIQFSKHVIPRKTTRKRVLEKLQEWRTPNGSERFWRQVLFYVRCHRISLQGLMEVQQPHQEVEQPHP